MGEINVDQFLIDVFKDIPGPTPNSTKRSQVLQLSKNKRSLVARFTLLKSYFLKMATQYEAAMRRRNVFVRYSKMKRILKEITRQDILKFNKSECGSKIGTRRSESNVSLASETPLITADNRFSQRSLHPFNKAKSDDQISYEFEQLEFDIFHIQEIYFELSAEIDNMRIKYNQSKRYSIFYRYGKLKRIVENALANKALTEPLQIDVNLPDPVAPELLSYI